jgi:plasmid rolling circle replication initiator protein Rep
MCQIRNRLKQEINRMTYTTEETRTIAEIRHKSKMATLDKIAKAETIYNTATAAHKATLGKTVAGIETDAKAALKTDVAKALSAMRTDEMEGDNDE